MGVAQNSLLGAGAALGIAANKAATGLKSMISEANDAKKNKAAAERARQNVQQAKEDKQTLKKTIHKAFTQNDPKARADLREMGGK